MDHQARAPKHSAVRGSLSQMVWAPIAALAIFLIGLGVMLWEATREIPGKASEKEEHTVIIDHD
jgi:hypothetical protein